MVDLFASTWQSLGNWGASLYDSLMPDTLAKPLNVKPVSEDRRRPKALLPYLTLWIMAVGCVVFALAAMFLQR